jgi:endonuclease YncB( thermonuclease family)
VTFDAQARARRFLDRVRDTTRAGLGSANAGLSRAAARGRAQLERLPPRAGLIGTCVLTAGALLIGVWVGSAGKPGKPGERAGRSESAEPASTGSVRQTQDPAGPKAVRMVGLPEVIDTATLRINGRIVRLLGVEWARGGQADELAKYLGGREVDCAPANPPDVFRCKVEGRDLSEVVLYNGGGVATADAPPELAAAAARAKAERLGVWRK